VPVTFFFFSFFVLFSVFMSDKGKEKKMKPSGNDSCSKRGKTVLKKNVEPTE